MTYLHGNVENFNAYGEYTGRKSKQSNLWWTEAQKLEDSNPVAKLVETTGQILTKINSMSISTDARKQLILEVLKVLSEQIGLVFFSSHFTHHFA